MRFLYRCTGAVADFFRFEAAGGVVLIGAAVLALVWSNTPAADLYVTLLDTPVSVHVGDWALAKPLLLWINDGLMAVFFLLVGLEIKREVIDGELSSLGQAALPAIGALGGMAVPAVVYALVNVAHPERLAGWAIPTATDIAFAVGVLALIGRRVPVSLKVFLLALAVMDDLGAIVIIALFYTSDLSHTAMALAAVGIATLIVLNLAGVRRLAPYVLTGIFLWVCVLKSGVHATLAGVAIGLAIPFGGPSGGPSGEPEEGPSQRLEHMLLPWVSFAILPLFAFANAGVSLAGISVEQMVHTVPLGILLGLVIGKPVGVLLATSLAIKAGWARLPAGASVRQFAGVAVLTGIGFTMSLFIGTLAFPETGYSAGVRLGVLVASSVAACAGWVILSADSSKGGDA